MGWEGVEVAIVGGDDGLWCGGVVAREGGSVKGG